MVVLADKSGARPRAKNSRRHKADKDEWNVPSWAFEYTDCLLSLLTGGYMATLHCLCPQTSLSPTSSTDNARLNFGTRFSPRISSGGSYSSDSVLPRSMLVHRFLLVLYYSQTYKA